MSITLTYSTVLLLLAGLFSCKKEDVTEPLPAVLTKWEIICGEYKVYDTLGGFLYDMNISHSEAITQEGYHVDSLHFQNLDGQFNFGARQSYASNYPKTYFDIGYHKPVLDTSNNRWVVNGPVADNTNIAFNDSIVLSFAKDNILYWISDVTPYHFEKCKQVAVKKH